MAEKEIASVSLFQVTSYHPEVIWLGDKGDRFWLLVYRRANNFHEFRDFFLDKKNSKEDCAGQIERLYAELVSKYITSEPDETDCTVEEDYARYLKDRSSRPLERLASLQDFCANSMPEGAMKPNEFVGNIFSKYKNKKIIKRLVHGD